ncbi:uncharacterized protein LOC108864091 [Galendromus occidentalis]|uniref:Uncharacterized protein LOC108864091 n=1 Tax=Galendromus occidentalis TaxID=34638 RepID=A0AAJ7P9G9_9ACAR|nr:uncharacterized protein LOC108864091 [Galendromus occidentalis]
MTENFGVRVNLNLDFKDQIVRVVRSFNTLINTIFRYDDSDLRILTQVCKIDLLDAFFNIRAINQRSGGYTSPDLSPTPKPNPRATQARQGRTLEPQVKAEFRSMHSEESQHVIEDPVHDLKTPGYVEGGDAENPGDVGVTASLIEGTGPPMEISRRMDVESEVLPPEEIKSKTLHFKRQDNETVVLYRPRNRSRQGYQRSRILVQKPSGGRNREIHKGKSLFYDSSAELLGVPSSQSPMVVPVVTKVLPDSCANRSCVAKVDVGVSDIERPLNLLSNLPAIADLGGLAFLSKLANLSYLLNATNMETHDPQPTRSPTMQTSGDANIRLAESKFHQEENSDLLSAENTTREVEGRDRGSNARSLFKLLGGGGNVGVGGATQMSALNASTTATTTATKTPEKESKMSPFRFGLQQLFTPRLPMAYNPMLAYSPQYPLLYPTRSPLLPLYAANGLIPTMTTRAPLTTSAPSSASIIASPEPRKSCSGECIDVFAALMCDQVDEEAHCDQLTQRCCVKGTEQVTKFLKRHGTVARTKKHKKIKKIRHKEPAADRDRVGTSTPAPKENSIEEGGVKIEIEEDHKRPERHRIFVHSTTSTKRPQMHIASGNGVYHVIGSKDVWTTRYPEIPKYVTIVTTTRKPAKQSATRRMDEAAPTVHYESNENDDTFQETRPATKRRHPQNLNDAELEMIESHVQETEIPFEGSQAIKQVNETQSANAIDTVAEAPPCPGNCVLPIFSFFCDAQHKTSYVCPVGRVCCVGTPSVEEQKNSTRTEEESNTNTNALLEDDRHDHICAGRCVPVFFQYTCKHPLRITDDICPTGSLCCTGIGKKDDGEEEREDEESQTDPETQDDDEGKKTTQAQAQSQKDAAEVAKNKLNFLHSILTTVLSTKKPNIQSAQNSAKLKQRPEEYMQADEDQLRPTYVQEPKYFAASEQLASEESTDPPEVVIEPAIPPSMPTVDTRFSQLERPPMVTPPYSHRRPMHNVHGMPPAMRHRNNHNSHNRIPSGAVDEEMLERHYPIRSRFQRPHPYGNLPHRFRTMPTRRPYDDSEEMMPTEEHANEGAPETTEETPIEDERENFSELRPDMNRHSHKDQHREVVTPETENHEVYSQANSQEQDATEVQNFTSPFLTEWAPSDVNAARVKEVNSANLTLEERPSEDSRGVHPSSCGLNGFHIKRWHSRNEANPGEWCWQAAIVDSDDNLLCSGAVIGAQWIATSASCVANYTASSPPDLRAKIGYVDMASGPVGSQTKTVSMVYSHHSFNAQTRENDIALLKLHDFIDLNGLVCVICLPSTLRPEGAMEGCTLTAYRKESPTKFKLTYDRVNRVDLQVCGDLASLKNSTAEASAGQRTKFCAGEMDLAERTGACEPSSLDAERKPILGLGNPLVCRVDNFYQLSGISSTYLGCEQLATPTYYTNLAYFTGWINQITNVNRYS